MKSLIKQYSAPVATNYLGKNIFHLHQCESTQDKLKEYLKKKYPIGSVVIADRQTGGRGQHGNQWIDFREDQLFASFSFHCPVEVSKAPLLNLLIAISTIEIIFELSHCGHLKIKWPNDIYLNGKKIGGVLSEIFTIGNDTHLIAGLGLNLGGNYQNNEFSASSLSDSGIIISRFYFLHLFLERFEKYTSMTDQQKLLHFIQTSFQKFNLFSKKIIEFQKEKQLIHGQIHGVDTDGSLLLEKENSDMIKLSSGKIISKEPHGS